jgi:hypothetical protein
MTLDADDLPTEAPDPNIIVLLYISIRFIVIAISPTINVAAAKNASTSVTEYRNRV